jgi:hypothetical protein
VVVVVVECVGKGNGNKGFSLFDGGWRGLFYLMGRGEDGYYKEQRWSGGDDNHNVGNRIIEMFKEAKLLFEHSSSIVGRGVRNTERLCARDFRIRGLLHCAFKRRFMASFYI